MKINKLINIPVILIVFMLITTRSIFALNPLHTINSNGGNSQVPWIYIASSSTGQNLVADDAHGNIYTSSNYGLTWINRTSSTGLSSASWVNLASSSTGQYLAAIESNSGNIYVSNNYGQTWNDSTSSSSLSGSYFNGITMSGNGQYLATSDGSGDIYVSNDYGTSWVNETAGTSNSGYFTSSVAMSDTGQYMITNNGTDIFISSDYGQTWVNTTSNTIFSGYNFNISAVSGNGQYMIVATYSGQLARSTNYGVSWQGINVGLPCAEFPWTSISISSNGQDMLLSNGGKSKNSAANDLNCNSLGSNNTIGSYNTGGGLLPSVANPMGASMGGGSSSSQIGGVYQSSNYGAYWTSITNTTNYANVPSYDIAMSSDGQLFYSISATSASNIMLLSNIPLTSSGSNNTNTNNLTTTGPSPISPSPSAPNTGYGKYTSNINYLAIGVLSTLTISLGLIYVLKSKRYSKIYRLYNR